VGWTSAQGNNPLDFSEFVMIMIYFMRFIEGEFYEGYGHGKIPEFSKS